MGDPIAQQKLESATDRSSRAGLNPYVMADVTFTREELLRAREEKPPRPAVQC